MAEIKKPWWQGIFLPVRGHHLGHPSNFTCSFSVPSLLNSIPIRVEHLQTNLSWTKNTSTFSNLDPRNLKKIQVGPRKSPCFSVPKVGALEALVAAMEHPESTAELQFLGAAAISASLAWRSEAKRTTGDHRGPDQWIFWSEIIWRWSGNLRFYPLIWRFLLISVDFLIRDTKMIIANIT